MKGRTKRPRRGRGAGPNPKKHSTHCHGEQRGPLGRNPHLESKETALNVENAHKPGEKAVKEASGLSSHRH